MKKIIKAIIAFFEIVGEEIKNRQETPMKEIDRTAGVAFMWN